MITNTQKNLQNNQDFRGMQHNIHVCNKLHSFVVLFNIGSRFLCIPNLAWNVVLVNHWILQEHVEASLILRQRMSSNP
jgi:hypothetical protein